MRVALIGSRQLEEKQEYFEDIKLCYNVCMRLAQLGVTFTSGLCEIGMDGIAQKAYSKAVDLGLAKEMLEQGDCIGDRSFEDCLLWSRGIIDDYENTGKTVNIAQVDNVFLGHTVLKEVTQVGNCTFLDTAGVFQKFDNGYKLSVIKLADYC